MSGSNIRFSMLYALTLFSAVIFTFQTTQADEAVADTDIEEVVVTSSGSIQARLGARGSLSVLSGDEIAKVGATHSSEVLNRVAGVWINKGSGQEHLTAIRSAVYTGTGACGEFAFLEDGIPHIAMRYLG